ncbi:AAA family ATPase [Ventrimonas sp. CLA-AP-H27]|uniref:AAA family ATPase n=2 Tax=Ventrimonas faecis TaxID=3133170 RepID=A0ABV1HIM8_9FIRM
MNSEIYVDKTGLLTYTNKVMNTLQGYICNSRPRRFGKSIAANMLTAYYSRGCDSEAMFSGLTIGQAPDFKTHLNRYDVIHLDIQWCIEPAGGAEKVVSYITEKTVGELREYYPAEIPEHVKSLPEALSCVNGATGRKFILIIDEWDVLIRDEADNQKIQEDYIRFLRALFKGTEPTKYIQLAYLTGILPIKKVKTQSALNNFDEYTMLFAGALAPYVGFTEDEVRRLCGKYQRDFEKVKRWYDGYLLGNYQVYNPRAVVTLMLNGQFKSYWSETGSYEAIVPLLNMDFDGLKSALIEMIAGNSVEVQVGTFQNDVVNFANKDDVLTYLIHLGYLAYDQNTERAFVPNEEIRQELIKATQRKKWNEFLDFQRESFVLLDATLDMDAETVAEQIEKIHMDYASAIQYHNENSLSSVLSIAYLSAMQYYFKPVRELPTGRGFADFVFIPKPEYIQDYPAMVVELKWNRSAKTAMQQIKERHYPDSLKAYTGEILLVAVNYDKKTKVHQCLIEKYEKEG